MTTLSTPGNQRPASAHASDHGPGGSALHRWTFGQLLRVQDDEGRLDGRRVELLEGKVYDMAAQKNTHWIAVTAITTLLQRHLPEPYFVGSQATHRFDEQTAPEPDVNVLPKPPPREGYARPDCPVLIVEVADSTLGHDRAKASVYAAHGVGEYWIVNLQDRQVEVYRDPESDAEVANGGRYRTHHVIDDTGWLAPAVAPDSPFRASDMLG